MDKKIIISIFIGIIIIVGAIFLILSRSDRESAGDDFVILADEFVKLLKDERMKDNEVYICMAVASDSQAVCAHSSDDVQNCISSYNYYRALMFDDDACEGIDDPRSYFCRAYLSDDISICDSISSGFAGEDEGSSISVQDMKILCHSIAGMDRRRCNSLRGELKDKCNEEIDFIAYVKSASVDDCYGLSFDRYIKCKAWIESSPDLCVNEMFNLFKEVSRQDCNDRYKRLSLAKQEFCSMWMD